MSSTYKVDQESQQVYDALVSDFDFNLPVINLDDPQYQLPYDESGDLYKEVTPITVDMLTTGNIEGTGVFDLMMKSVKAHLRAEYDGGRITGAEYTKAYIASIQATLSNATQFLLGKDQAFWQAQAAQIAAITGVTQLATAKMQFAATRLEAANQGAQYALTKARLGTESVQYATAVYNLETMLPVQKAGVDLANELAEQNIKTAGVQYSTAAYNLSQMLPAQYSNLTQQTAMIGRQITMITEQTETYRAQTLDTRTDGQTVAGSVGKQKALYTQQITSYLRNDERSAAKIYSDVWTAMKTIDEGLTAPNCFSNTNINTIMNTISSNNNLG